MEELQELANRKDIRSADRAVIRNLVRKMRRGQPLTYQERHNAWAYIVRYRRGSPESGNPSRQP